MAVWSGSDSNVMVVAAEHGARFCDPLEGVSLEERVTIHEKSRGETINVYIGEYAGKKYLHVREWYLDKDQTEKPTKKGVAIPVEKVELLLEAIKKLMASEPEE